MKSAAVLDLGLNNLRSLTSALSDLGYFNSIHVYSNPSDLVAMPNPTDTILILPGTGNFGSASRRLHISGIDEFIRKWAERQLPLIGICLGMQLLSQGSEEAPTAEGLGLLPGTYRKFSPSSAPVPNIGWASIDRYELTAESSTMNSFDYRNDFYFVHSYYLEPIPDLTVATSTHGPTVFSSIVQSGRVLGVQFHPEKSGVGGLALLREIVSTV